MQNFQHRGIFPNKIPSAVVISDLEAPASEISLELIAIAEQLKAGQKWLLLFIY